jgi:hypothetical protein
VIRAISINPFVSEDCIASSLQRSFKAVYLAACRNRQSVSLSEPLPGMARLETPLCRKLHPSTFPKLARLYKNNYLPFASLEFLSTHQFNSFQSKSVSYYHCCHGSAHCYVASRHLSGRRGTSRDEAMGELVSKVQGPVWQASRVRRAESGAC